MDHKSPNPPAQPGAGQPGKARPVLFRCWFDVPLWKRIIPAMLLGVLAGLVLGEQAQHLKWLGDVFIRLTRMLVVPLVFFTITSGIIALGDIRRLGALGLQAVGLFALSAAIAATIGLTLGLVLHPGVGVEVLTGASEAITAGKSLTEQLLGIIPVNPVKAFADGDTLATIFFAAIFAVGVLAIGARSEPLANLLTLGSEVMIKLVGFVIEFAPFGVFGLMAAAVGLNGPGIFINLTLLTLAVAAGSLIQVLIVQPTLIRILAGLPGVLFLRGVVDAIMVAFSTSSSSASFPVELVVAEKNLGIGRPILLTVLPFGVSVGRDGAGMYIALLSVFATQALGIPLAPSDLILIVAVSSLVALSAPPVPSAALFMMAAVLSVVGVSDAQSAMIVGFILPFDRLLDMMRTVPNVLSNLTNTTIIARWAGELDLATFRRKPVE